MTTMTADALLQAILANPGADAPRLIYADWLEERDGPGDAERAEFVRVQCELARLLPDHDPIGDEHDGQCVECNRVRTLRRRERELLPKNWFAWTPEIGAPRACGNREAFPGSELNPSSGHVVMTFRRGFIDEVACPLDVWTPPCPNAGRAGGTPYHDRHGCTVCRGTGRVAGVGAALVACQPVTTVRVTDREPDVGNWWYRGTHPSGLHPESDLPEDVFDLLGGGELLPWGHYDRRYDSQTAALADLSSALLRLVKGGDA